MRQQTRWITEERLKVYGLAFTLTELALIAIGLFYLYQIPPSEWPSVIESDFRVFWAAGHLALHGDSVGAYDQEKLFTVMRAADPALGNYLFGWFYPPTFLLLMMPLALLPWALACILFVTSTFAAYLAVLRKIAVPFPVWWFAAGSLPVLMTVFNGQNAFLTATLAGVALIQLDRRPMLSGVCIGLLTIKPQLVVLFPVALVCGRHWKALGTAAFTSVLFFGVSVLAFGTEIVPAFLGGIDAARKAVLTPGWPLDKMASVYAALVAAGIDGYWANSIQGLVAVVSACAVIQCWRLELPAGLRNSVLILASLLVSPHLFSYDLTWFALPIIWMAINGKKNGWLIGERTLLLLSWQAPLILSSVTFVTGANLTQIILLAALAYCVARVQRYRSPFGIIERLPRGVQ